MVSQLEISVYKAKTGVVILPFDYVLVSIWDGETAQEITISTDQWKGMSNSIEKKILDLYTTETSIP